MQYVDFQSSHALWDEMWGKCCTYYCKVHVCEIGVESSMPKVSGLRMGEM
jgi:hypothetical protein